MTKQRNNPDKKAEEKDDVTAELLAELAVKEAEIADLKKQLKSKKPKVAATEESSDEADTLKKALQGMLQFIKTAQGGTGGLPKPQSEIISAIKLRITDLLTEKPEEEKPETPAPAEAPLPEPAIESEAAKNEA